MKEWDQTLKKMFQVMRDEDPLYLPSKYWEVLNEESLKQLDDYGVDALKTRQAFRYFQFVALFDEQFRFLLAENDIATIARAALTPISMRSWLHLRTGWRMFPRYSFYVRLLWEYAAKIAPEILETLSEPKLGDPFPISWRGRLISQDLANAALEAKSIEGALQRQADERFTICELGAGYGRTAYVLLNRFPKARYIVVDIAPALLISQWYLTSLFPHLKAFTFRDIESFESVRHEFESADLVFMLPSQAAKLPSKCVDLFVNISSLHEMRIEQIEAYFVMIDRLTNGVFYTKQWKETRIPYEDAVITMDDYPVRKHWKTLFRREARVQTKFFEAAYQIGPETRS